MNQKEAAGQIVADPGFEVLEFVKHLDVHYGNDHVIRALCKEPTIILAIVESGHASLLECRPKYVNKTVFEPLHEMGFEVWKKTNANGNLWYGVVVSDEVCFHFRYLSHHYEENAQDFEVVTTSENPKLTLVDSMRAKWRRLKMLEIGKPIVVKERKPQKPTKVIPTREEFSKWFRSTFNIEKDTSRRSWNRTKCGKGPDYRFPFGTTAWKQATRPGYSWPTIGMKFRILADGPKRLKVCVDDLEDKFIIPAPPGGFVKTSSYRWNEAVTASKKFDYDDQNLFLKIAEFASSATQDAVDFKAHRLQKLDKMVQDAKNASKSW